MVISRRGALQLFSGAASLLVSGAAATPQTRDEPSSAKKWFEAAAFVAKDAFHTSNAQVILRDNILNEFVEWVSKPAQAEFRNTDFIHGRNPNVDAFTLAQDAYLGGQGRYESYLNIIRALDEGKPYALPEGYKSSEQLNIALLASVDFAKVFLTEIVWFARPVVRARIEDGTINAIKSFLQELSAPKPQ